MCAILSNDEVSPSGSVYKCNRCSHVWVTRKSSGLPRSCPSCRSILWNRDCNTVRCLRCGYEWVSTSKRPGRCPGCHTSRWDTAPAVAEKKPTSRPAEVDPAFIDEVTMLHDKGMTAFEISCKLKVSFQSVRDIVGPDPL